MSIVYNMSSQLFRQPIDLYKDNHRHTFLNRLCSMVIIHRLIEVFYVCNDADVDTNTFFKGMRIRIMRWRQLSEELIKYVSLGGIDFKITTIIFYYIFDSWVMRDDEPKWGLQQKHNNADEKDNDDIGWYSWNKYNIYKMLHLSVMGNSMWWLLASTEWKGTIE